MADAPSLLELVGIAAVTLTGAVLGRPSVITLLEWMGYRIYDQDDACSHNLLVGIGVAAFRILLAVALWFIRERQHLQPRPPPRNVRRYRRREESEQECSHVCVPII